LSALTTKTAVYVLARVFAGTELLLWAGVIMALYGVVFAVLENDIRRLLAYHIVSQVGYMVAAVGIGTGLALNGATAHAYSHILYKALLFMGAGAVVYATGREKLTELGGIWRKMPLTVILYTVGAFSISGVPLFNGFISKSIVISSAAESGLPVAELLLTLASVGTFLSIGLKLPYFMFFAEDRGIEPRKLPLNMTLAMSGGAFLCILYGVYPSLLYARLPFAMEYHPYSADHVASSVQLLLMTGAGFWLLTSKLRSKPTISLDTDWLYRRPLAWAFDRVVVTFKRSDDGLEDAAGALVSAAKPYFRNPFLGPARLLRALGWGGGFAAGGFVGGGAGGRTAGGAGAEGAGGRAASGAGVGDAGESAGAGGAAGGAGVRDAVEVPYEYDENLYRFPVGLTILFCVALLGFVASFVWLGW